MLMDWRKGSCRADDHRGSGYFLCTRKSIETLGHNQHIWCANLMSRNAKSFEVLGLSDTINPQAVKGTLNLKDIEDEIAQIAGVEEVNPEAVLNEFTQSLRAFEKDYGVNLGAPTKASISSSSASAPRTSHVKPTLSNLRPASVSSSSASRSSRSSRNSHSRDDDESDDCSESCECECHFDDGNPDDCSRKCRCPCHEEDKSGSETASYSSRGSSNLSDRDRRHFQSALASLQMAPTPNVEIPSQRVNIDKMLTDIDFYVYHLRSMNQISEDELARLPRLTKESDPSEVQRLHSLLHRIFNENNYFSTLEDMILAGATVMEHAFDGQTKIFGKYPISYAGMRGTMGLKMRKSKGVISDGISTVAEKHGISPQTFTIIDLFAPLLTTPVRNMVGEETPSTNGFRVSEKQ